MQMPQVWRACCPLLLGQPQSAARVPRRTFMTPSPPGRQESPNAPMVEGTKKRDNETVTEEVGSKHARRAPDVSNSPPKTFEPDTISPVKVPWGLGTELGDFGAAAPLDKLPYPARSPPNSSPPPRLRAAQSRPTSSRTRASCRSSCATRSSTRWATLSWPSRTRTRTR